MKCANDAPLVGARRGRKVANGAQVPKRDVFESSGRFYVLGCYPRRAPVYSGEQSLTSIAPCCTHGPIAESLLVLCSAVWFSSSAPDPSSVAKLRGPLLLPGITSTPVAIVVLAFGLLILPHLTESFI